MSIAPVDAGAVTAPAAGIPTPVAVAANAVEDRPAEALSLWSAALLKLVVAASGNASFCGATYTIGAGAVATAIAALSLVGLARRAATSSLHDTASMTSAPTAATAPTVRWVQWRR
jgi:hypothetical protein